jgi:hypothetical protein
LSLNPRSRLSGGLEKEWMMQHTSLAGAAPRITFTNDFHELVRGDLAPDAR